MQKRFSEGGVGIGIGCFLMIACSTCSSAGTPTHSATHTAEKKESTIMQHASGTFDVTVKPLAPEADVGDPTVGRMSIDKQFHGDIEGVSKGQMLAAMSEVKGSAGYVAIERVTATLKGRTGTFALQHTGTMTRGAPSLTITVVPDSGTGELVGLSGKMTINIVEKKHFYEFEYTIAGAP